MMTTKKIYKINFVSPTGKTVKFYTDVYTLIDNSATLEFIHIPKMEHKRVPYVLCEINVIMWHELPEWIQTAFSEENYETR